MSRANLEFQVDYSIALEEMQMVLFGRLDRFCTFLQLVLGTAVFAEMIPSVIAGACVAVVAAIQVTYQPGSRSMEAKYQRARYILLKKDSNVMDDDELQESLAELQGDDSPVLGALTHPAYLSTSIARGLTIDKDLRSMNRYQSVCSFFAGNYPKL